MSTSEALPLENRITTKKFRDPKLALSADRAVNARLILLNQVRDGANELCSELKHTAKNHKQSITPKSEPKKQRFCQK